MANNRKEHARRLREDLAKAERRPLAHWKRQEKIAVREVQQIDRELEALRKQFEKAESKLLRERAGLVERIDQASRYQYVLRAS